MGIFGSSSSSSTSAGVFGQSAVAVPNTSNPIFGQSASSSNVGIFGSGPAQSNVGIFGQSSSAQGSVFSQKSSNPFASTAQVIVFFHKRYSEKHKHSFKTKWLDCN